ncbi:CLOCK-interacting pacemaker [Syngnathus typhle]|uniref:CLOCK-interacting pacemaker n=1 Tax=Syngnathus typhle TaxID=161592 RepID=UPI002A6AFEA2|nr:CLOCK-interacting pacemaker [Syngnathus typhle]XP_061136705.1 CLOCK-interacting pacemaker [Syngnathus typhle]XP_061136706.1 CLOCK-interacting pacemaker [Syngnathus typhle]XP_061136707.1 CLOCK-interacting pacemaker [Syngnathus typhle]
MVKEELGPGEFSSKNAKDKSNSSTLRAMREIKDSMKDDCSERGSCCSSEKDSGYSDNGSDWQQTDVDQQSNKRQTKEDADVLPSSQGQNCGKAKPGNPQHMPRDQANQRMYILNNVVLKQPETIPKSGELLWTNSSSGATGSGGTHMILFQQPSLIHTALQLHKPSSQKNSTAGKKVTTYLPILNSYPRIAPHPSKKPPDKSPSSNKVPNLSKRVCTEHKGELEPVARSPRPAIGPLEPPALSSSGPTRVSSNSAPCSPSTSTLTSRGSQRSGNIRHRRFLNTVEILRQSGLLDITMRTKELLRQSNVTEREIAELRRHTDLLCQAASASPSDTATWQTLYRTMAESNCYADLQNLQHLKLPSHRESPGYLESAGKETTQSSGSSSRLSTTPRPNCGWAEPRRELLSSEASSEEVTFMFPDSSTG